MLQPSHGSTFSLVTTSKHLPQTHDMLAATPISHLLSGSSTSQGTSQPSAGEKVCCATASKSLVRTYDEPAALMVFHLLSQALQKIWKNLSQSWSKCLLRHYVKVAYANMSCACCCGCQPPPLREEKLSLPQTNDQCWIKETINPAPASSLVSSRVALPLQRDTASVCHWPPSCSTSAAPLFSHQSPHFRTQDRRHPCFLHSAASHGKRAEWYTHSIHTFTVSMLIRASLLPWQLQDKNM